jgi:diguanylate cyclase (GGDEF)-like protein
MNQSHYRRNRAIAGFLLSLGAPLGWLAYRVIFDQAEVSSELSRNWRLYSYLSLSTAIAFTVFGFLVGRIEDKLSASAELLTTLSLTDSLTGLPNRRAFEEALERTHSFAARRGTPFSIVMLDIDHFKRVNDTYGHEAGDQLLSMLGKLLLEAQRREDFAARIGGEEFAIVMPADDAAAAAAAAERVLQAVRHLPFEQNGVRIPVTVSAGVAQWDMHEEATDVLRHADQALYDAKRSGRDRVSVSSQT